MCPPSKKPLRVSAESVATSELELAVLRALCTQTAGHAECAKLASELAEYRWREADHRVIYEALIKINSGDPEMLRRRLPAATTRMGFPEIDWQRYFSPTPIPADRLSDLIRTLKSRATRVAGSKV
jgi:hypothetical protein